MERELKKMLERIFSDAAIVDIDLSEWDRGIALYAFADHLEAKTRGIKPFVCVFFAKCKKFNCDYVYPIPQLDDSTSYCQWHVHEITYLSGRKQGIAIQLSGPRPSPSIEIECEEVLMRRIDARALNKLFPGWRGPGKPFVRPGIKALLREIKGPAEGKGED